MIYHFTAEWFEHMDGFLTKCIVVWVQYAELCINVKTALKGKLKRTKKGKELSKIFHFRY